MTKLLRVTTSLVALSGLLSVVGCERASDKNAPNTSRPAPSGANAPKTNAPAGTTNQPGSATGPRSTNPPP